jgi:hypothetical protein
MPLAAAEGRPIAPVPLENAPQGVAPLYEIQRMKRTVPMDAALGLEGRWDEVYSVPDGNGKRTLYFNWDDQYLYFGLETPESQHVRFEIDAKDDGWLRGADNLAVQLVPPATALNTPEILAYRFDTVQNRDQPVWAGSPIPAEQMRAKGGRTNRGTYVVMVAIPRSEEMGLDRKPGATFGVRYQASSVLSDPSTEAGRISTQPMTRLTLADNVPARSLSSLTVRLSLDTKEAAPGDGVKTTMEIKNESGAPQRVGKMFLGGSLTSSELLDSSTFAAFDLPAGKSIKREIKTSVAPSAPYGALVVRGGYEMDDGTKIAALVSFDRVEPHEIKLELDKRPVSGASELPKGDVRQVKVVLRSRVKDRATARVSLKIPEGWSVENNVPLVQERQLNFKGDSQSVTYKLFIPIKADLGTYPIEVTVDIAGRTYKDSGTITIAR